MLWSVGLLTLLGLSPCFACKFYQFVKEKKNWTEARDHCRQHYTDLATVMNKEDVERLKQPNLPEKSWIGLYSNSTDKKWLWSLPGVEFDNSTNMWDDKEPSAGPEEDCGTLRKNKKWNDSGCHHKYKFICYDGNNMYEKFHLIHVKKNWSEAQRYCRENHTDLISGRDQLEEQKIEVPESAQYFIGLFRDTWRWSDGSRFSFRNWTDLGNNQGSSDQCVALTEESLMMSDECNKEKPFFCYVDKVVLIRKKMNWENALYYCREHHQDLVTIRDPDEQQWVQEKAKKATTPFVWMGLHHTCTLGFWFWVGGESVRYNNWNQTAVRDECNMSAAMEASGQHKWLKKNDDEEFNFICSKY